MTPESAPVTEVPWPAGRRVLVVDDHRAFGEMLAAALTSAGLRCVGVLSGADGVSAAVGRLRPDVVVMDIEMPGVDGIAATRDLRTLHPHVAVVIASAYLTARRRRDAARAGASAVIAKDGSLDVLLEALRSAAPLTHGVDGPPTRASRPRPTGGIVDDGAGPDTTGGAG